MSGKTEEAVLQAVLKLQDDSLLPALRGICSEITSQLKPGAASKKRGFPDRESSSRLFIPFVAILRRISGVSVRYKQKALLEVVAELLKESPWIVDVLLRNYLGDLEEHPEGVEVLFESLECQKDVDCHVLYSKIVRIIRRHHGRFVKTGVFVNVGIRKVVSRLERSFASLGADCPYQHSVWVSHALHLASLSLIDGNFESIVRPENTKFDVITKILKNSAKALSNPETLVTLLGEEAAVGVQLESVMALVEVLLQLVVVTLKMVFHSDNDSNVTDGEKFASMQEMTATLLTVRWELDQVAKAIGHVQESPIYCDWDINLAMNMVQFFIDPKRKVLTMTPPQISLAIHLILRDEKGREKGRKSHSIESRKDLMRCVESLKSMLYVSSRGILNPKEALSEQTTQSFANLAQRIRVVLSEDSRFKSLIDGDRTEEEDEKLKTDDEKEKSGQDDDVSEFLALIGRGKGTPHSQRAKKSKRIVAERIGDTNSIKTEDIMPMEESKNSEGPVAETCLALYQHNGRVIMPATLNLDSDTRELLWKAYIDDKDTLVEMLGDSNYQQWHDETLRPALRRKSGMEKAFNDIFGESTLVDDPDLKIENGRILDEKEESLMDSLLLFPWQSLLSGVLMLVSEFFIRCSDPLDRRDFILALFDEEDRQKSIGSSLRSLHPDHSRALWKFCCKTVEEVPILGTMNHLSILMKQVIGNTSRHTTSVLFSSFLELLDMLLSYCKKDVDQCRVLKQNKFSLDPLVLIQASIRSCTTYPPVLGSSINSKSAKVLPSLCGIGRDTEVIIYLSSSCWIIWQSLKGKENRVFWLPDGHDFSSNSMTTAHVPQKYHYLSKSMHIISCKIQEIHQGSIDIISSLQAVSSLCATMCVEISNAVSGYKSRNKNRDAFQTVCLQKDLQIGILSVISSLCQIYCGLAEDWEELLANPHGVDPECVPDAGSIIWGFDFVQACHAYSTVLERSRDVNSQQVSSEILKSSKGIVIHTKERLEMIMTLIQNLERDSELYKLATHGIESLPELIVLDHSMVSRKGKSSRPTTKQGKRLKDISNPFVKAILQESGRKETDALDDDELSDLEDFIVANPDTDYVDLISNHFPEKMDDF